MILSHFDYENAKRDIADAGGDPDYLSHYNEQARDRYLKKVGLNPQDYGGSTASDSGTGTESVWNEYEDNPRLSSTDGDLDAYLKDLQEDRRARRSNRFQGSPDKPSTLGIVVIVLVFIGLLIVTGICIVQLVEYSWSGLSGEQQSGVYALALLWIAVIAAIAIRRGKRRK